MHTNVISVILMNCNVSTYLGREWKKIKMQAYLNTDFLQNQYVQMQILLLTSKTIGIWSGIKLYKAINIVRYKNTSFSNLGKKKYLHVIRILELHWLMTRNKHRQFINSYNMDHLGYPFPKDQTLKTKF